MEEWENSNPGKQKEIVKKLIEIVLVREDGIEVCSGGIKEFIAMNLKKKANKRTVVEPEGIFHTDFISKKAFRVLPFSI